MVCPSWSEGFSDSPNVGTSCGERLEAAVTPRPAHHHTRPLAGVVALMLGLALGCSGGDDGGSLRVESPGVEQVEPAAGSDDAASSSEPDEETELDEVVSEESVGDEADESVNERTSTPSSAEDQTSSAGTTSPTTIADSDDGRDDSDAATSDADDAPPPIDSTTTTPEIYELDDGDEWTEAIEAYGPDRAVLGEVLTIGMAGYMPDCLSYVEWHFPESGSYRERDIRDDHPINQRSWVPFSAPSGWHLGESEVVSGSQSSTDTYPPYALPATAEFEITVEACDGTSVSSSHSVQIVEEPVSAWVWVDKLTAGLGDAVQVEWCAGGSAARVEVTRSDNSAAIFTGSRLDYVGSAETILCPNIGQRVLPFSEMDGIWTPVGVPPLPAEVHFDIEVEDFDGIVHRQRATVTVTPSGTNFDVTGVWSSSIGATYTVTDWGFPGQPEVSWSVDAFPREVGQVWIERDRVHASWRWEYGPDDLDPPPDWATGSASATIVEYDASGRPITLEWDNGGMWWRID